MIVRPMTPLIPDEIPTSVMGDDGIPIEIVIEGDDSGEPPEITVNIGPAFSDNLAEHLDESYMSGLANELLHDFDNDRNSRKDWEDMLADGLDLLGLRAEDRMEPWPGACGVTHPLLLEATVRFQAEMITETLPASGPVKADVIGKVTDKKLKVAERVCADMNYQITKKMPEFRSEQERMFWALPLTGSAFKKVYEDPGLKRQTSMFVAAEDFVVSYGTSSLSTCPRATHVMRKTHNELRKLQVAGFYRDVKIDKPAKTFDDIQEKKDREEGYSAQYDDRHILLEMSVDLDLEGFEDTDELDEPTGIALPYIVTIDKQSAEILSIRRNWVEGDPAYTKRQHFVHYPYVPGFGFYGFGLIHLVGGFSKSATSLMRQLIDAGTLSNLPGGFKSRGMRVIGDDTPISPGEFRDVDVPSGALKDNILPLPYKEPSATLFQLLQMVVDEGRRMASVADLKIADMNGQTPVGTTLAILERTLKVMSAVQSRVYYAFDQELKLLAELICDTQGDYYPEELLDEDDEESYYRSEDYKRVEILPVSNPNASTMAQRVMQYQAALQLAQQTPDIYDLPKLHKQMLDAMGIEDVDSLIPTAAKDKPKDPISENMALMNGHKARAYIFQDHDAHIQIHQNLVNDPKMQQVAQNNPNGSNIMAAIQAHIMEHVAFQYRQQIELQLGTSLPGPDEEIPPEIESNLSALIAQASQQLLQKDQNEVAQQQAQQQQQDPLIQMQQQELQLKTQEVQSKIQVEQLRLQLEAQSQQLKAQQEQARLESQERIAAMQIGAKTQSDSNKAMLDAHRADMEMQDMQARHLQQYIENAQGTDTQVGIQP